MIFWINGQWLFTPTGVKSVRRAHCVHVGPGSVRAALHNVSRVSGGYRGIDPIAWIVISLSTVMCFPLKLCTDLYACYVRVQ
jgi:hypothetical protein